MDQENLSVPEVVKFVNGVAEYLTSIFEEIRESHSEASRFWNLFGDDESDTILMLKLNSVMLHVSELAAKFSASHQHTVEQLAELAVLVFEGPVDAETMEFVLFRTNQVTAEYARYGPMFEKIRNAFSETASQLLFPVRAVSDE